MTGQRLAAQVESQLRAVGDPERAEHEKRYLKSDLEHAGASVPAIRKIAKATLADHPTLDHDGLVGLVNLLWARPLHECRMAAVDLLELRSDALRPADMKLVERLIRESRTWALVDGLAANVTGALIERHPELSKTLDRWSSDADFWVRRSALLAFLVPLRRGRVTSPASAATRTRCLKNASSSLVKPSAGCFATPPGSDPLSSTAGSSRVRAGPRALPCARL